MSCGMCKTTVTPCWREGPNGPRTLCNACGIRWKRDSGTARPRKKKPNQADSPSSPNSGGSPNGTHGSGGAESPSMGGESTPKPKRRVKKIRDRLDPVATPGPREASEKTRASLAASKDSLSHHSGSGGSGSNSYNGYNQNTSVVLSAISKGSSTGAKLLQQVPQETSFLIPHDNGSEYFEMLCEPKHYHSQLQASLDTLSATPGYWIQNPPPSSSSSSSSSSGGRGATMPVPRVPISSPNPFAGPSLLFELHNRKLLEEALDLLQIMNLQQKRNARKVERLLDVVHDPQLLKRAQLVGSVIRHQLRTQKVKYHLRRHLRHSGLHLDSPHLSSSGLSSAVDSFKLLADIADADHLSRRELEILEAELGISSRNTFCPDDYEDDEDEFYDEDEDDDDDDDDEDHVGNGSDLLSGLDSKDAALRSSLAKFLIDDDEEDEEIYYDDDDFYHGDSAKAASSLDDNTDQDLNELATTLSSEDSASQPKETEATNQPTDQALLDEDMALASASETQPASVSSSEAQGSQPPIVSKSSSSSSALALDHLPAAKKASGGLELAADKIALQKRQKDDEKAAKARLLQKQKQKQVAAQRRSSPKSQIYTRPSFPALVLAASINSERLSGSPSKQASAPILSPPSPLDLAVSSSSSSLVANEEPSSSSASSSSTLDTEMIASNTL